MYTEMVFGIHLFSNEYKDLCYNNSNSTRHARHSSKAWPAEVGAGQPYRHVRNSQRTEAGRLYYSADTLFACNGEEALSPFLSNI